MFASRTPRDIIRTPEDDALIAAGDFCEEEVYGLIPARFHNPVNPILVEFRADRANPDLQRFGRQWGPEACLAYLERTMELHRESWVKLADETVAHIDHARKVLTRLASLIDNSKEAE